MIRTLPSKKTIEVLDMLRKIDGLTFDFHKTIYSMGEKKDELSSLVQEAYKKFISENSKIPAKAIDYVGTFGSSMQARSESYHLEIRYSFNGMKTSDLVKTGFGQGCVRVNFGGYSSAAIVSFEEIHQVDKSIDYICKLNNISHGMKIHQGKDSEIILAQKYQSKLYNLLESKLLVPEF